MEKAVDRCHIIGRIQSGVYEEARGTASGDFYRDLVSVHDLNADCPKTQKAYSLAWDWGHSSGHNEVLGYFEDIAELLR